ncbi:MAG: cytochrome P450 [Ardenticatenaceae bacterium]|nr:cytochrome P450 [Anaerolineales bacterium]MCB8939709.1 cytochrome P450 [Ardenticatenaceae bacterium]MCB8975207.1 cytochrome P450 [Ardenticatenaceae bacterium]
MAVKRPSGPKGALIMGNASQFSEDEPTFLLENVKKYGDLVYFRLAHLQTYLVAHPDLIREVLVTQSDKFEKAPLDKQILGKFLGNGLLTSDGAFHRRQRRLAQPAFHSKRIHNYAEVMVDYANQIIGGWQDEAVVDITEEMMHLTMLIVSKTLFDADAITGTGDTAEIIGNAMNDFQAISNRDYQRGFSLPNWVPTADNRLRNRAVTQFNAVMNQIIAERRKTAVNNQVADKGDLLSMLMLSVDEDGEFMDDKQLRNEVATLFAAGHETTSNALSWTWFLLAQHPEAEAKLHEELDTVLAGRQPTLADLPNLPYSLQIIKEAIRMYPPAWILNGRRALEDVQLGGYTVPKGSTVFVSPYVMHHLPQYFDEPEAFKPERFTAEFEKSLPKFAYMPFGGGARVCIGNAFAMMEAQLILATIAQKYRLTLAQTEPVRYKTQITLTAENGIQMRVLERETAVSPTPELAFA